MAIASSRPQVLEQGSHLERCKSRLPSLVGTPSNGALLSLFQRFTGQYAKGDRNPILARHSSQSTSALGTQMVEVGRIATNYRAERNEGIYPTQRRNLSSCLSDFPGARHSNHLNI